MRKLIAILLAGMMTATAFAGCSGGGDGSSGGAEGSNDNAAVSDGDVSYEDFGDEDDITLKVWAPDAATGVVEAQCQDFIDLYSEKNISIEVVAQGEDDAKSAVLNDAETAADVFGFAGDQLNDLVDAGVIAQVAYVDEVSARDDAPSVEAATIDGTLYAYPETTNGYYLVYDKSLISDEQAATWETLLEACREAGKKFVMDIGNGYYACVFAFTAGVQTDGYILDETDTKVQQFIDYDEDEAVATLRAFAALLQEYSDVIQALDVANVNSGFTNGTVAAGIDGSWNSVVNEEALGDNFGGTKLPTIEVNGEAKQSISMYGYKYIGVNASSKYPRTAQILANYLADEECQRDRAEQLKWGPTNTVVAAEDVTTSDIALAAITDQSEYSVTQANITSTFWDPMANLGNQLNSSDFDYESADTVKDLLETTVKNIKDEA